MTENEKSGAKEKAQPELEVQTEEIQPDEADQIAGGTNVGLAHQPPR